jgi:transposase InsO family protein
VSAGVRIAVGERLFCVDGVLEITALEADQVTVCHLEDGVLEELSLTELLALEGLRPLDGETAAQPAPSSVLLDRVPAEVRTQAEKRLADLSEAICGFRSGNSAEALEHEPRPQYDPRVVPELGERLVAKAEEMTARGEKVSARTLRRWRDAYDEHGLLGLVDKRYQKVADPLKNVPPEFLAALDEVLLRYVELSTVDRMTIRREVRRLLVVSHPGRELVPLAKAADRDPADIIVWPGKRWFYEIVDARTRTRQTFGAAKTRKSVANRPGQALLPLRATRSGEIVQLDSTRLDVLCLDPTTGELVRPEVSVAIDAYDRCVRAVRVVRSTSKGLDAALLMYDMLTPEPVRADWPEHARWHYGGVPAVIVSEAFASHLRGAEPAAKPMGAPGTVVIDHGKIYMSEVFRRACEEFGVSVQPAPPGQPTYKAIVERFFEGLTQGLLQHLPGYTGRSVHERGRGADSSAVLTLEEMRELIVDWIVSVYHAQPHDGCRLSAMPQVKVSPNRMFEESIARGGFLVAPPHPETLQRILPFQWRTIQHYGIDFANLRYSGEVLERWRDRDSGYRGRPKQHPIHFDPRDLSRVWFRDPQDGSWHALRRLGAAPETVDVPFSEAGLAYAKRLLVEEGYETRSWDVTNDKLDELLARRLPGAARSDVEARILSDMADQAQQAQRDGSTADDSEIAQALATDDLEPEAVTAPVEPASPLPVADGPVELQEDEDDGWGVAEPLGTL